MTENVNCLGGKVTASKDTLCVIGNILASEADRHDKENRPTLAEWYREGFDSIYNALDNVGFYDEVKKNI